ncbi:MAG TPA: hypothetical protein DDX84_03105 [Nitrospiraceae bacterium]|nr:MAG: hypothetical protein A3D21_06910 [Nitrospirae bacterium RIFCSPHIGHO2_02_FULL_42_12]HBI23202.1 hypothetical protein [Nitrospiraceae bacterium]
MPKALKRIISLIFVVIIFYFIGRVTYKEWDKFYGYNWSPNPPLLISSIIILLIAYILFSHGWTLILRMIGVKIEWRKGLSICLLSIFGRYIPGGIWTVLGKVYLCRLEGIPDSRSSMSILLDQSYTVVSAGIIFTLSLLFWNDSSSVLRVLPVVIVLPLFIVILHPKPFLKILNPVLSWIGRGPINMSLSFNNMLILAGYYSFNWLLVGVSFYIFIRAFYPIELYNIFIISGIYAISFAAGFVIFFMPAGLGVREGTLTLLLSLFIPTPVAIGISLLSRLWIVVLELLILLFFLINTKTRRMVRTALGW